MAFKINVSHKGKTLNYEINNENLNSMSIGDKLDGKEISNDLEGYELEITGTSDKAGFPGLKNQPGPRLRGVLLTYGLGMKKKPRREGRKKVSSPPGLRLRKTVRGKEISSDTVQINTKVIKLGKNNFEKLLPVKEKPEEKAQNQEPTQQQAEKKPAEQKKEEKPADKTEAKEEVKTKEIKQEKTK